jgi:hypothetical protein
MAMFQFVLAQWGAVTKLYSTWRIPSAYKYQRPRVVAVISKMVNERDITEIRKKIIFAGFDEGN